MGGQVVIEGRAECKTRSRTSTVAAPITSTNRDAADEAIGATSR
jgi:hypothetical protein